LDSFNRSRAFAHAQKLVRLLTQGRALFTQITLIIFIVEPPKLYSGQIGVADSKNVIIFQPLLTGHVIRRIRSDRVRIFNGKLEGKYSLESTDPFESEIRAPRQLTIALKLSYLFIIAKLFKVKDGCLKFVYIGKNPRFTASLDSNLHTRLAIVTENELGLAFPPRNLPKNFVQICPRFIYLSW